MATADHRADRKLRANSCAVAFGRIIRALISSSPTTRIDDHHGDGGEHREQDVVAEHRHARWRGRTPRRWRRRTAARRSPRVVASDHGGEHGEDDEVARLVVGEDGSRRGSCRLAGVPALRPGDEHHAAGDAAVEQHGQRDVAAGAAAGPDQLDGDRADDGRDQRRQHRAVPVSTPTADAGQGDVAHAVADQGQPALHQEDADQRARRCRRAAAASRARCMKS